jgi:hypothetical protein
MNPHSTRLPDMAAEVCAILERSEPTTSRIARRLDDPLGEEVLDRSPRSLVEVVHDLTDTDLESLLRSAADGRAEYDRVIAVAAGEAAKRSRREVGHGGLAQRWGHRTAVQLVQSLTGESKGEAARQIKVGELLGETEAAERAAQKLLADDTGSDGGSGEGSRDEGDGGADSRVGVSNLPWQHPITHAITAGTISAESGHLIVRVLEGVSESCPVEARRVAAAELVTFASDHAGDGPLRDDILRRARQVRDRIDTGGIEERYTQRYQRRSLKTWRDADGALNLHAICDDESGVFLTQMLDLALSPRRGGPRFIAKDDIDWARRMMEDPRSNEQLAFDTLLDVLRAGTACDDSTVFRTDRPGVRLITVIDAHDARAAVGDDAVPAGQLEGSAFAVPGTMVGTTACTDGIVPLTVDRTGRVLNLGRTKRHFSAAQRVVLRGRDGGCLWPGCDRPAWQTEAHHINEWKAEGGRTDIADGVCLCRFHHLNLHNNHWRIRRRGMHYELLSPPGTNRQPIPLLPKSATWELIRQRTG